jgi:hypothetical protein
MKISDIDLTTLDYGELLSLRNVIDIEISKKELIIEKNTDHTPNRQLVYNGIITPDGTVLSSYHRHDYKTYTDANGHEYMVDGGLDYLRRNVVEEAPHTDISVYDDEPHEKVRNFFHWGNRGKDGKQPLTWKPVSKMSNNHIDAILETQKQIPNWVRQIFEKELAYREDNVKHIKDE